MPRAPLILRRKVNNMKEWFAEIATAFSQTFIEANRWKALLSSIGVTLRITFFALILGLILGILVAVVRSSHDQLEMDGKSNKIINILNSLCSLYLTVIRGTPVMVQMMIMYFVIMASTTNKILVGTITFGINSGAYVAEIIRSGIMSIDKGQMEAGRSLGFNYVQTMGFIIIPQAIKNILPALGNEFIALLKETSIVNIIGIKDLTKWAMNVQGRTYEAFMPFIGIAAIYLVIVIGISKLMSLLERKMRNE